MLYTQTIISIIETLLIIIPVLLTVAFVTVAERKTMASMQRRLGPNFTGYYGLLQAFADALKLLLKEYVSPTQANITLFFIGPIITLVFSLLSFAVIPYVSSVSISDFNLGIIYILAMSSLATYGILISGWAANSKYAFLGSLRSTAQLISYELILSSAILLVVLLTGSLNLIVNTEAQKDIYNMFPLFPIFIIFFIGCIAETNRPPFDLAEAESELVSGFMTEHAAVIFVFFFLAEYASIVLICILTSVLFIGGYLYYLQPIILIYEYMDFEFLLNNNEFFNYYLENLTTAVFLGIKACVMIFIFIWARASLPRIRFDQLMLFCWTILLPIVIGLIVLLPCILFSYDVVITNTSLLGLPLVYKSSTESVETILEDSQFIRDGNNLVPFDTTTQTLGDIYSNLSLFNKSSYDRFIDKASLRYNQFNEQSIDIPNFYKNFIDTPLYQNIKQGCLSLFEYFNLDIDFSLYHYLYDSLPGSLPVCAIGYSLANGIYHSYIRELYHVTNPTNNTTIAYTNPNFNLSQWSDNLLSFPQGYGINVAENFRYVLREFFIRAGINISIDGLNNINDFNDLFSFIERLVSQDTELINRIERLPITTDPSFLEFTPTPLPQSVLYNPSTYTYGWRLCFAIHMYVDYVRFYSQARMALLHWDRSIYSPNELQTGREESPIVTLEDLGLSNNEYLLRFIEESGVRIEGLIEYQDDHPGKVIINPRFIWDLFFRDLPVL